MGIWELIKEGAHWGFIWVLLLPSFTVFAALAIIYVHACFDERREKKKQLISLLTKHSGGSYIR